VTGYPTLKFFPKGSTEATPYESSRTEAALTAFLNEKAGTHRAVGGGLNEFAGRIAAFDEELKNLVHGEVQTLTTVTENILKLAEESKDTYVSYYVKALSKLTKDAEYVEKELKRIRGILARGGDLASKKKDEFTVKANILAQFYAAKAEQNKEDAKDEL